MPSPTDPDAAVFIEFCCGSAALSAAAQKAGFQVFPIDHAHNRFRPKASIVQIDLSDEASIDVVVCMINFLKPRWLHFGLPCGTCSRARERPVAAALVAAGAPQPRPLRDADNLLGRPGLSLHEKSRVETANQIYRLAVHALAAAFACGALVSLENPVRSWLWALLAFLVKQMFPNADDPFRQWFFELEDVDFDMCMHGGERAKTTRLKAAADVFSALRLQCDKSHEHRPWTVHLQDGKWTFDTAAEAEYPSVLALKMVQCVVAQLPTTLLQFTYKKFRLDSLQAIGKQSKRHGQLIPEFKCFPPNSQTQVWRNSSNCALLPLVRRGKMTRGNCLLMDANLVFIFHMLNMLAGLCSWSTLPTLPPQSRTF